ncbi:MAG: DUF2254 domain-containing protein [Gammaproteobacteria bacterium]|nr:DUF2254 domain-containing protein [Gammaproteobacteria bacterium]
MNERWQFWLNRIGEKLWVKPLLMCVLSLVAALLASLADETIPAGYLPDISLESIQTLLTIISSSMLVIATFAVGSMVSAYASASVVATPRAFALIVADDVSQNALSVFIGALIFSIVALAALLNGYYDQAGRFTLFVLTLLVFTIVIVIFVRWVDRIARLGRLETTIRSVERATLAALDNWRRHPNLGGTEVSARGSDGLAVFGQSVGYVQHIEINRLQNIALEQNGRIEVVALPGSYIGPNQVIAYWLTENNSNIELDLSQVGDAFRIGEERTYDEDPRFGLVVLSEIASRALSPGINDAGTAIQVIGSLVRIFSHWASPIKADDRESIKFDRVAVPGLSIDSMFEDAFRAIARDGAASIEVVSRLQKGLEALATCGGGMDRAACEQARRALGRAESSLQAPEDLALARELTQFAQPD